MGRLLYTLNVSLDGFVEGPNHDLSWTQVDDELHSWFNQHHRELDASLYGRGLYELMAGAWPDIAEDASASPVMREYGQIWLATPRYVFSSTLESVAHNSTLVRGDIREELARIRERHAGDLEVGGATLAHAFIRAGLVDQYRMVVHPVVVGRGTPYFPPLDQPLHLRLIDSKAFASGAQMLAYVPAG
jgi:dihydrofolate reductase